MTNLPQKNYYKIGEVAKYLEINASKIRFWEKEFEILNPKKNKKGDRCFTQKDITVLKTIFHLTQKKGMTLEGAKKELKINSKKRIENQKLILRLEYVKKTLSEIKKTL